MSRRSWTRAAVAVIMLMTACACTLPPLPTAEDDAAAIQAVDAVRHGDFKALDAVSGPEMKTPEARANLAPMRALFPNGEPLSVKRVSWRANANVGQPSTLVLAEAYDFPDRTVTATVVMAQAGAPHRWRIIGMNVNFSMKAPAAPAAGQPT